MTNLTLVKNDINYYLNFSIKQTDPNDPNVLSVVDLTNSTVVFKLASVNNISSVVISATCAVISATLGTCRYLITDNGSGLSQINTAGTFKGELQINYTSGQVITAPNIMISVTSNLGG
jgi:hypothetical protein